MRPSKLAVRGLPKNRIGRNSGLIVSNQKVPRPRAGSIQYRRTRFGSVQQADKVWIGGSSIGDQFTHFKTIAHAILAHYLPKFGDLRASNAQTPALYALWLNLTVEYAKDAPTDSMQDTGVPQFENGTAVANSDYNTMAHILGDQLMSMSRKGLFPSGISFKHLATSETGPTLKYRDTNMGRHSITVSCEGRFRFQNITPAGTGAEGESTNINAVDANPASGKIYTFRNQAPLFSPQYMSSLSDGTTIAGVKALQTTATVFDVYGTTVTAADGKGGDSFLHLAAPPLNAKSIWRNTKTTGNVVFPPGGFKTYSTSYLRSESIAKYCQNICQADAHLVVGTATTPANATYPPAGDSFMMCLRPTIKTATGEHVRIAYNCEHIMKAMIKRVKASPLQVVNLIE